MVEGLRILLAAKLAEIVQQHTKDLDVNHTSPSIFELFGYTVSAKESDKEGHELCSLSETNTPRISRVMGCRRVTSETPVMLNNFFYSAALFHLIGNLM